MLSEWIETLSRELEMEPPTLEDGAYNFPVNDAMTITLSDKESESLLFSVIAHCPEEKKEEIFIELMGANFLGVGTGGAAIALDQTGKSLTLFDTISYEENYRGFKEKVEDFANYIDYWREEISRLQEKLI